MQINISRQTADIVAASIPLIAGKRAEIERAMAKHMARAGPFDPSKGRHQVTSAAILDMLLDHVHSAEETGRIPVIGQHGVRHRRMAIDADHYAAFGNGLATVLRDVLRSEATPDVVEAWDDAYRSINRGVLASAVPQPA